MTQKYFISQKCVFFDSFPCSPDNRHAKQTHQLLIPSIANKILMRPMRFCLFNKRTNMSIDVGNLFAVLYSLAWEESSSCYELIFFLNKIILWTNWEWYVFDCKQIACVSQSNDYVPINTDKIKQNAAVWNNA